MSPSSLTVFVRCVRWKCIRVRVFNPSRERDGMVSSAVPLVLALVLALATPVTAIVSQSQHRELGFGEVIHRQLVLRGGPLGRVAAAQQRRTAGQERRRHPPAAGGREVLVASVAGFFIVGATSSGITSSARTVVDPACAPCTCRVCRLRRHLQMDPVSAAYAACALYTGTGSRRRWPAGGADGRRARRPALGPRECGFRRCACGGAVG